MTFNFMTQMTLRHFLPMPMNKKLECKDHQIYSKMLRKICKKGILMSVSFESHKKLIFWSPSLYIFSVSVCLCLSLSLSLSLSIYTHVVKTFPKFFADDFLQPVQNVFLLAVELYPVRQNISTLPMLVYYNTNSLFLRSLSVIHCLVCSAH